MRSQLSERNVFVMKNWHQKGNHSSQASIDGQISRRSYVKCLRVCEAFISAGKPWHRCAFTFPCRANKTFPTAIRKPTVPSSSLLRSSDPLPGNLFLYKIYRVLFLVTDFIISFEKYIEK